jgi:RecB family exonuclease
VRGTVVHKVLEDLFDLPALDRTPDQAQAMLHGAWAHVLESEPEVAEMFTGDDIVPWLASCRESLRSYFRLEDPRRLEPAEREVYVEALLDSRLLLRGFVDRIDVAPDGALRVVDYKGLAVDTPLPTPTGWTTMGDVRVGDLLLGHDGRPTRVTRKSGLHERPCYRVTLRDGSSVVCDNVHLWAVVTSDRQTHQSHVVDTAALSAMHEQRRASGTPNSMWIEAAGALQADAVELPIDPWLLGAWLGDGSARGGDLTVGRSDITDMLALVKEHWPRKVNVREEGRAFQVTMSKLDDRCQFGHPLVKPQTPGHRSRRCAHEGRHASLERCNVSLGTELERSGLRHRKHIPSAYLRASYRQRCELLRGLMDTDGWWNAVRHRAGFTTTDDRLAEDVVELLRTLGINPCHFRKPYQNRVRPDRTWHVIEFTPTEFNPFSLPRKALAVGDRVTQMQKSPARRRIIKSIELVESVPTQCIAVDADDSMFLCGRGFIPTHNTGRAPGEGFESKALFQMRFYALVIWRTRGVMPRLLQLIYLGNGQLVTYEPDEQDLLATERLVEALWRAIRTARETGEWVPHKSWACSWCSFKAWCPEWGGTPPPLPVPAP